MGTAIDTIALFNKPLKHTQVVQIACIADQLLLLLQIPLSALANDPSAGFIDLIEHELLVCCLPMPLSDHVMHTLPT